MSRPDETVPTDRKRTKPERSRDARQVLGRGLVVRALRAAGIFHVVDRRASLTMVVGVPVESSGVIADGLKDLVRSRGWHWNDGRGSIHDWTGDMKESSRRREANMLLENDRGNEPAFVLVETLADVPPILAAACDGIATLGPLDAELVGAAFSIVMRGQPVPDDLELAARLPPRELAIALRRGRPVPEAMATVRRLLALKAAESRAPAGPSPLDFVHGPRLVELHGLGEASTWGRSLVADLRDYRDGRLTWTDMDRGALLTGPPGVGKTMFARALATSAEVPFHAHSLARWQARGHLGDLLKAMGRAFDEARASAPCVLLVDELDAIGSRDDPGDRYAAYTRQVVDAFLEHLDGAAGREGVVVIGATNLPDLIDPAILRPGRLDRTVAIPLPDAAGREGIMRHHLRGALRLDDLRPVAERMRGMSGADIERVVRDARRVARKSEREIAVDDLERALPPVVELSDAAFRRACVHEAGHWVVGTELGPLAGWTPTTATVSRHVEAGTSGWTEFARDRGFDRTRASALAEIAILLAGTAAEEVVLGNRGDGSGGRPGSDLHVATAIAVRLEVSHGLGAGLAQRLDAGRGDLVPELLRDPSLLERVEATLSDCLCRAREVVLERRHEVERTATLLAGGCNLARPRSVDGSRASVAGGVR
ncbi:AAA family ATPase [uncultured Aureimonas sp.]|uniref:AAA family ATPase n=1 Tax=uncultured Aureimonas sp. TaxID=1604662 RepID=UPI0025D8DBF0|nr:AAA family ATPase [uncultured Aureimonas sp.]